MRVVDCHVHMYHPIENPSALLKEMDKNGIDRMIVFSRSESRSIHATRRNLMATKALFEAAPDRIGGLARIEPTLPGAASLAREALESMGFLGLKIIPDHWYAYEERLEPFWEAMNEVGAIILFHTGILWGNEDGSRFNRPVHLEKLLFYPKVRFLMAHISWPWCDECLAVMGRMRAAMKKHGGEWQSYIDLTPGTPPYARKQAIANALSYVGPERLLFGTDSGIPGSLGHQKEFLDWDMGIFDELGLDEAQKARIFSGNADELFPPGR